MTTTNNTVPNPNPNASLPSSTPEDDIDNNALYQAFMARENQSSELNVEDDDGDSGDGAGGEAAGPDSAVIVDPVAGSGGGGSVAPSLPPPDASTLNDDEGPVEPQFQGYQFGDVEYTPQDMERIFGSVSWLNQLTPLQVAFIDGVLSGQINVDPSQIPGLPGFNQQDQSSQSSESQPSYQSADPDDDNYVDPAIKAELDALRSQVEQTQLSQQQIAEQAYQRQHEQVMAQIDAGVQAFQQAWQLSDPDRDELLNSAVTAQVIQTFSQSLPPEQAIQKALEHAYWNTPKFRDQYVQQQVALNQQQQVTNQQRISKVSALTSSGGSVDRNPPPTTNLSKPDRQKAMAAEIAAYQNGTDQS